MQSRLVALHQGEVSQRHYWSWGASLQPHLTMGDCRAQLLAPPNGGVQPAALPEQWPYLNVELSHQAHPNMGSPHSLSQSTGADPLTRGTDSKVQKLSLPAKAHLASLVNSTGAWRQGYVSVESAHLPLSVNV